MSLCFFGGVIGESHRDRIVLCLLRVTLHFVISQEVRRQVNTDMGAPRFGQSIMIFQLPYALPVVEGMPFFFSAMFVVVHAS